jgi:hypothetical protein
VPQTHRAGRPGVAGFSPILREAPGTPASSEKRMVRSASVERSELSGIPADVAAARKRPEARVAYPGRTSGPKTFPDML